RAPAKPPALGLAGDPAAAGIALPPPPAGRRRLQEVLKTLERFRQLREPRKALNFLKQRPHVVKSVQSPGAGPNSPGLAEPLIAFQRLPGHFKRSAHEKPEPRFVWRKVTFPVERVAPAAA